MQLFTAFIADVLERFAAARACSLFFRNIHHLFDAFEIVRQPGATAAAVFRSRFFIGPMEKMRDFERCPVEIRIVTVLVNINFWLDTPLQPV